MHILIKKISFVSKKDKMTSAVAEKVTIIPKEKVKRLISLESFRNRYANREDDYKYEWNNGIVEKTPRTMRKNQYWLVQKLMRLFILTDAFKKSSELMTEVEMFLPLHNRTRIPDMALMTKEQIHATADDGEFVSEFVVEIISKFDKINEVETKLDEYFANGVKVVWRILPQLEKVEVYTSPTDVKICRGATLCSTSPILPDFEITAEMLFQKS